MFTEIYVGGTKAKNKQKSSLKLISICVKQATYFPPNSKSVAGSLALTQTTGVIYIFVHQNIVNK